MSVRILHLADSALGLAPRHERELRAIDVLAAFERALQVAIDVDADIVLHTGGLVHTSGATSATQQFLARAVARLLVRDIVPVVFEEPSAEPFRRLGSEPLTMDTDAEACGVRFTCDPQVATSWDGPCVLVQRGIVDGMRFGRTDADIDPRDLLGVACSYIALSHPVIDRTQVQPNAWYCGHAARTARYDTRRSGGLVVDIGQKSGRLLSVEPVHWADRPLRRRVIDANGLDPDVLPAVVEDALRYLTESATDEAALPSLASARHRELSDLTANLADLYGRDADSDAQPYAPTEPVAVLEVRDAAVSLDNVRAANPQVEWLMTAAGLADLHVTWNGQVLEQVVPLVSPT